MSLTAREKRLKLLVLLESEGSLDDLEAHELEVMRAEDVLIEAKSKRKSCSECGRIKPASKKAETEIEERKLELRAKRQIFREARKAAKEQVNAVT